MSGFIERLFLHVLIQFSPSFSSLWCQGLYKSSLTWLSFVRLNIETVVMLNQTSFCFSMLIFFFQNKPSPLVWGFVKKKKLSLKNRNQSLEGELRLYLSAPLFLHPHFWEVLSVGWLCWLLKGECILEWKFYDVCSEVGHCSSSLVHGL